MPSATKAGRRHNKQDESHLKTAHDSIVALGATCDAAKAVSLDERAEAIRRAVYRAAGKPYDYGDDYYVELVYEGYAIVRTYEDQTYYRVNYTEDDTGITAAPRLEWQPVEKEWAAKTLVTPASTGLKALGNGKVGGYLVLFSDATKTDLTGDFFDAQTDYDVEDGATTAVYYHHGLDPVLKARKLGTGTLTKNDVGVWLDAQLALRDEYERAVYGMVEAGKCGLSSGTAVHLVERVPAGKAYRIARWPLGLDASITPTPAEPRTSVLPLKSIANLPPLEATPQVPREGTAGRDAGGGEVVPQETTDMAEDVKAAVAEAMKAWQEEQARVAEAAKAEQAKIDAAVAAAVDAERKTWAQGNRLPSGDGPTAAYATKYHALSRFDGMGAADTALLISVLESAKSAGRGRGASDEAYKALAIKLNEDTTETTATLDLGDRKTTLAQVGRTAMKAAGIFAVKTDEIMQSDLTAHGVEWVGDAFTATLWNSIRQESTIVNRIPSMEFPAGADSYTIPLEGADPTFYHVPEAADTNATSGLPNATVPLSQLTTANKTMTLGKIGARVQYTGELQEDSMVPFVSTLRMQLANAGREQLEALIIDGDTTLTANTNINDIAGTPAATDLFTTLNGFRKLALVTNTANSRAGGVLTSADFLETVMLMGAAGMAALDQAKINFIVPPDIHWWSIQLADVKSRDVFASPTIENGMLTGLFGYGILRSAFMHFWSTVRRANTAGKVDQDTVANNTTSSILAVRWDQWLLGYRRRMTIETERIARADAYEIVALMRLGLTARDNEAAAISYGLTQS